MCWYAHNSHTYIANSASRLKYEALIFLLNNIWGMIIAALNGSNWEFESWNQQHLEFCKFVIRTYFLRNMFLQANYKRDITQWNKIPNKKLITYFASQKVAAGKINPPKRKSLLLSKRITTHDCPCLAQWIWTCAFPLIFYLQGVTFENVFHIPPLLFFIQIEIFICKVVTIQMILKMCSFHGVYCCLSLGNEWRCSYITHSYKP